MRMRFLGFMLLKLLMNVESSYIATASVLLQAQHASTAPLRAGQPMSLLFQLFSPVTCQPTRCRETVRLDIAFPMSAPLAI